MDTSDGTYLWEYSQEDCSDSVVQLYEYLDNIKLISSSRTSSVKGLTIVKGTEKEQVAGLGARGKFPTVWKGGTEDSHKEYRDVLLLHGRDASGLQKNSAQPQAKQRSRAWIPK